MNNQRSVDVFNRVRRRRDRVWHRRRRLRPGRTRAGRAPGCRVPLASRRGQAHHLLFDKISKPIEPIRHMQFRWPIRYSIHQTSLDISKKPARAPTASTFLLQDRFPLKTAFH